MQSDRHARTGTGTAVVDPLTGRLLDGRYRIGPRIARGGMASVYEATDIRLDRTVAVKVMHPGLGDDDDFASRFVREARAAARLSHPNIVGVYDQGDDDGTVFLVMELVPGHTLRDVIRKESPLTPARALALLDPVLSALATAHRAGLIHRDVKPENVLIATEPQSGSTRVKVADFGLAKAVSADTQHTATGGVLIGTVSYLAPELVVDGRADARVDVYAAGVLLYELLTGQKPHEGESPIQVAYKHVHEDVPPPSAAVPGIPSYVDALVARATARDRDQRPADAAVLLHQVHRVSLALAEGLDDDAELTQDLNPTRAVPMLGRVVPAGVDVDTDELPGWLHGHLLADDVADTTHPIRQVEPPAPTTPRRSPPPPAPPASAPSRPRRSRRGPIVFVLALLLAVGVGAGAWWFGWARWTQTPSVLGLDKAAAVKKLEAAGLEVAIGDPAYSENVKKNTVLSTSPTPGERVLHHGTVTLVMSLGKERYDVPKLRGLTEDQAQDALADAHLEFGESVGKWSQTVDEGLVIGSDPGRGTRLKPGAVVDLAVSKGPKPIRLRDWTGKDADTARTWLEARGLRVDTSREEYSDTVPEGNVVSQSPTTGPLYRGNLVHLVVSRGPELVEVPRVIASGRDAAVRRLEDLGFKVRIEHDSAYIGLEYVLHSSPSAGDEVPRGSTITIYLI